MDNIENLATLGTQYTNRTKTNKILKKTHHYKQTNTINANKT